jgi:hypothetical protein
MAFRGVAGFEVGEIGSELVACVGVWRGGTRVQASWAVDAGLERFPAYQGDMLASRTPASASLSALVGAEHEPVATRLGPANRRLDAMFWAFEHWEIILFWVIPHGQLRLGFR